MGVKHGARRQNTGMYVHHKFLFLEDLVALIRTCFAYSKVDGARSLLLGGLLGSWLLGGLLGSLGLLGSWLLGLGSFRSLGFLLLFGCLGLLGGLLGRRLLGCLLGCLGLLGSWLLGGWLLGSWLLLWFLNFLGLGQLEGSTGTGSLGLCEFAISNSLLQVPPDEGGNLVTVNLVVGGHILLDSRKGRSFSVLQGSKSSIDHGGNWWMGWCSLWLLGHLLGRGWSWCVRHDDVVELISHNRLHC